MPISNRFVSDLKSDGMFFFEDPYLFDIINEAPRGKLRGIKQLIIPILSQQAAGY